MIKAITFDVWDTLLRDNSDEEKRVSLGLPSKMTVRERLLVREIRAYHPSVEEDQILEAWKEANRWLKHSWKEEFFIPSVSGLLQYVYSKLGVSITPGFERLVDEFESMEEDIAPALVDGAAEVIEKLAENYRLGIIADTAFTPGLKVRKILEYYGLLKFFKVMIFSDEIGSTKPFERGFRLASQFLGAEPSEMVHIGDREERDIKGAHEFGMKAILFTGVLDRGSRNTSADAVCRNFSFLPGILEELEAGK